MSSISQTIPGPKVLLRPVPTWTKCYLFVVGLIAGYFWLSPVFKAPTLEMLTEGGDTSTTQRLLRVGFLALALLPFAHVTARLMLQSRTYAMGMVFFLISPALSAALMFDRDFVLYKFGPFAASGTFCLLFAALDWRAHQNLIYGVGTAALAYVGAGFLAFGITATEIWGRSRVHLGFSHPTQTASALLFAVLLLAILTARLLGRHPKWQRACYLAILVTGSWLLYVVQSRNTFLFLLTVAVFVLFGRKVTNAATRMTAFYACWLAIVLFFAGSYWFTEGKEFDLLVDEFSSGRVSYFREELDLLFQSSIFKLVVGGNLEVGVSEASHVGFATSHSALLSLWMLFGFLSVVAYFALNVACAKRLARIENPLFFAFLNSCNVFYVSTSQGITTSNLTIYLAFCVCFAIAVRSEVDAKSAIPGRGPASGPSRLPHRRAPLRSARAANE